MKPARASTVTSLQFFSRLKWLDGTNLLDGIEPYRREIFTKALDSFDENGRPLFSMVVSGRGKKNAKSLDLVLAALFVLVIRRSIQGSDGIIVASDEGQSADDLGLARKLVMRRRLRRAKRQPPISGLAAQNPPSPPAAGPGGYERSAQRTASARCRQDLPGTCVRRLPAQL